MNRKLFIAVLILLSNNVYAQLEGNFIDLSGSCGGTPPYRYSIDGINYQSTPIFFNVIPGKYTGYTKDFYDCIGTKQFTLAKHVELSIVNQTDSTIQVMARYGVPPYLYRLGNNPYKQNKTLFTGLTKGFTYTISVRDGKGIYATQIIVL